MANKRNKTRANKRKVNPLTRGVSTRARPKSSFDGSVVNTTLFDQSPSVAALSAQVANYWVVDCNNSTGANRSASAITGLYSQYRYNSCSITWLPSQGPASALAGSRMYVAYIDSPERISNFVGLALANRVAAVKSIRNVRIFNIWERFTYRVPLTWRRKVFDVNFSNGSTPDEVERSMQGMIIFAAELTVAAPVGGYAAGELGVFKLDSDTALHNLILNMPT